MRKDELKASLDKIQPREELIKKTLLKIEEKKYQENTRYQPRPYPFAMKLAGAVCAFALVFVMGFVAARHGISTSLPDDDSREQRMVTVANTDGGEPAVVNFEPSGAYSEDTRWIAVKGQSKALRLLGKSGESLSAVVEIVVERTERKSDSFSLDSIPEELSISVTFEDKDTLNGFVDCMSDDMLFYLVLNEDGSWTLADFEIFE